ncbi:hypothetical protein [Streptomyces sp. FH025]|uniref:hypothetical protein n=1 Tax=Streptomyces sp. FH025 TaxID=2815937 RepID=UPI001A9D8279|nr:hypothetical protein [Streptomyces sp. FH025]MBO1415725.1 hypothetical protein [Streptomyces sp. FH025]
MRNGDAVRTALDASLAVLAPHTGDRDWNVPAGPLCRFVLDRLFPDAPEEPDAQPAEVLLWCTGRGELNGRPRRSSWNWRAAMGEWPV